MSLQTGQSLQGALLPPPAATASAGCQRARSSGTSVGVLGSPVGPLCAGPWGEPRSPGLRLIRGSQSTVSEPLLTWF